MTEAETFRALQSRVTIAILAKNNFANWNHCINNKWTSQYNDKGDCLSDMLATASEFLFDYENYDTSSNAKLYDWGYKITKDRDRTEFKFYIDHIGCYKVTSNGQSINLS